MQCTDSTGKRDNNTVTTCMVTVHYFVIYILQCCTAESNIILYVNYNKI